MTRDLQGGAAVRAAIAAGTSYAPPCRACVSEDHSMCARTVRYHNVTCLCGCLECAAAAPDTSTSREAALEAAARAGYRVSPFGTFGDGTRTHDAENVLTGYDNYDPKFNHAVIAEARRHRVLVNEFPWLADREAVATALRKED